MNCDVYGFHTVSDKLCIHRCVLVNGYGQQVAGARSVVKTQVLVYLLITKKELTWVKTWKACCLQDNMSDVENKIM